MLERQKDQQDDGAAKLLHGKHQNLSLSGPAELRAMNANPAVS
jgi:hypothetical protein